jgi:dipeptidase D
MNVSSLEPVALWSQFEKLNAVPRPSKKEERIRQFMVDFGQSLGLETLVDKIGNVIIKKPASAGMENRKTVILQSHLDMVHQKNSDRVFDFETQGIEMIIEGDWVRANNTTLGADNGIGVAAIMAILQATDINHPAIEAFFTIDEETGMTGAMQMDGSLFNGEILLNLDTEDDDELSIGCAGGIDTNTSYNYQEIEVSSANKKIEISIRGLLGGHSGMDIDKGRGNANKWMSRILWTLSQKIEVQLISFDGGSLRNAIPREATAVISISPENFDQFNDEINGLKAMFLNEYNSIEPAIIIQTKEIQSDSKAVSTSDFKKIISLLCSVPNGVFRMSPDIEGLVEASSSLARVIISNGIFTTQSLQRSSVESTKAEIAMAVQCSFENIGCEVVQSGEYPGWKPDPNSAILKIMEKLYSEMFNEAPKVKACHAGLECGILGKHLPGVDMISFGPNIRAAHSPDEKVQISSVQKFWKFYLETLKQTPIK